jgi:hypothetical protein
LEVQNDADVAVAPVSVVIFPVMGMTVISKMVRGKMMPTAGIMAAIKSVKPAGTVIIAVVTAIA